MAANQVTAEGGAGVRVFLRFQFPGEVVEGTFELGEVNANTVTIRWNQSIDPVKGAEVMQRVVKQLVGGELPKGEPMPELKLTDSATVVMERPVCITARVRQEFTRRPSTITDRPTASGSNWNMDPHSASLITASSAPSSVSNRPPFASKHEG